MTEDKAVVKLASGYTINLGEYEFARIDVGVEIQGKKDELPELWKMAEEEIRKQMEPQITALKEAVDEKNTILGMPKGAKFK